MPHIINFLKKDGSNITYDDLLWVDIEYIEETKFTTKQDKINEYGWTHWSVKGPERYIGPARLLKIDTKEDEYYFNIPSKTVLVEGFSKIKKLQLIDDIS